MRSFKLFYSVLICGVVAAVHPQANKTSLAALLSEEAQELQRSGFRNEILKVGKQPHNGLIGANYYFVRELPESNFTLLDVDLMKFANSASAKRFVPNGIAVSSSPLPQTTSRVPSGLPLGEEVKCFEPGKRVRIVVSAGNWCLHIDTTYRSRLVGRALEFSNQSLAEDWVLAERLGRRLLGRLAGLESAALADSRVNGRNVNARRSAGGATLLDLTEWCSAKGIALNLNTQASMASFSANGRTIILPLASNQIKIGSNWVKADEISLLHEGKWFVPKALLDASIE